MVLSFLLTCHNLLFVCFVAVFVSLPFVSVLRCMEVWCVVCIPSELLQRTGHAQEAKLDNSDGSELFSKVVFRRDHSVSCSDVLLNSHLSRSSSLKCTVLEDKFGMNFPMKLIMPNARSTPFLSSGLGMSSIALILLLSGSTPAADNLTICSASAGTSGLSQAL